METYNKVSALAESLGVKIRYKDESRFMQVLGALLFFNRDFMLHFTTTIPFIETVYFPSRKAVNANPDGYAEVLAHELVHVMDAKDLGQTLYCATYLYPQCLALLSLLALLAIPLSLYWLTTLGFLLFLAPLEAPGRSWFEGRGYAMNLAVAVWRGRKVDHIATRLVQHFTGPDYYYMDRDHARVVSGLRGWLVDAETGAILDKLPLADKLHAIFTKPPA